jgi:hypothetical protein
VRFKSVPWPLDVSFRQVIFICGKVYQLKFEQIQSFQNENKDEDVDGDVDDEREQKRD